MKKIILYFSLIFAVNGNSQKSFIINDDLGHYINIGYMVAESADSYHVIGLTVENDTAYQSPFVIDIKKNGDYSSSDYAIFKDTTTTMFMNLNNKKYQYENEIEFGVATEDGKYIMRYDVESKSIYSKDSFSFLNPQDTFIRSFIPFKNGYLLSGSTKSEELEIVRDFIVLDSNDELNAIIRSENNIDFEYCQRVLHAIDSTYFGIVSTNTSEIEVPTINVIHFNKNGEIINKYVTNTSSYGVVDAMVDSNNNIIIATYDFLQINQDTQFQIGFHTPYLLKINSLGKLIWNVTYGSHLADSGNISKYSSIIESATDDGYIIVGSDYSLTQDSSFRRSHAIIAKVSLEGDSIWYRKYATIDTLEDFFHVFNDVIATQDGGYLAVGAETYWDVEENKLSQSLLIVKTDAQGLVEPDTSTSVVTILDQPQFNIYPNPASDFLYINKETPDSWTVSILDMNGKSLLIEKLEEQQITYLMDLKMFPSGTYVLKFTNGVKIYSEKVIIK